MESLRHFIAILTLFVLFMIASIGRVFAGERPPNVIVIFTDDMGYSDLGCYGATDIATPNLDGMAAEGVRFTDFYCCSPVCTPSRAALMTGRYPSRSGLSYVLGPGSSNGIPDWEITLGEAFKDLGYATACVGKWHLGDRTEFLPTSNGFDYYWGIPYSNDMNGENVPILENETEVERPAVQSTLTERYTQHALDWIDAQHAAGERFFLYFPHTFPHVPLYPSTAFQGSSARGTAYGDIIQEIDWSVGEVLAKLKALGIDDETLVVFSNDNGPWLSKLVDSGVSLPLRDGKFSVYDGGVRMPCIARWPGRIPSGRVENRPAIMVDWFPTLVKLCGGVLPTDRVYDGRDISGLLFDTGDRADYEFFFYRGEVPQAHRSGDWKLWAQGTPALYDLSTDISEATDLSATQTDTFDRLGAELAAFTSAVAAEGTLGDTDGDGIPDDWESARGLDPCYTVDGITDYDGDGFTSYEEYLAGSHPLDAESLPGPVNLSASAVAVDEIGLQWDESPVAAIVSYNVYRSTTYGFTPSAANCVATGVTATGYSDAGLAPLTTYFYAVAAVDGGGLETAPSRQASATTEVEPPAVPAGLTATALGPGSISLDWDAGTELDFAGYNVYRDTSPGFAPSAANLVASMLPGSAYVDAGLLSGSTLNYKVTAVDVNGNESPASAEVFATTEAALPGLVGHWALDEMKGPTAFDSSGNARDGALGPSEALGPAWRTGRIGGALEFDGQSDYVETVYYGVGGANPRTVAFWIRTTNLAAHGLVSWGEVAGGQKWHLRMNDWSVEGTRGAIRTEVQGGFIVGSTDIADGEWHHVASVFSGTDVSDVLHYVDGLVDPASNTSPQPVNTNTSSTRVNLGRRYQTSWSYFNGLLDDVRIYDRALSAADVGALYQAAGTNAPPSATDDPVTTSVSTSITVDVVANDTDADGETLAVTDATQPEYGSVRIEADGTVTYTPMPGFTGTDRFLYVVSDGQGGLDVGLVVVTVEAPAGGGRNGGCSPRAGRGVVSVLVALGAAAAAARSRKGAGPQVFLWRR